MIKYIKSIFFALFIAIYIPCAIYCSSNNEIIVQNIDSQVSEASMTEQNKTSESDALQDTDSFIEDINELDNTGITTKIYKSNDTSFEQIIEDESNLDSSVSSDIISKDELLYKNESSKNKILKRIKQTYQVQNKTNPGNKSFIIYWLISMILVILLAVIIKFVANKQ